MANPNTIGKVPDAGREPLMSIDVLLLLINILPADDNETADESVCL